MNVKLFSGNIERLRVSERVARLEVERVASLCLESAILKSVLEVGVGSGLFAEAFFKHGLKVAGVDINPQMVAAAVQFVPAGDFQAAAAESLPYSDFSFDLVFMGLLLHESDEPFKVLQEAYRVSRQRVCILEWAYREEEFGPPLEDRLKTTEVAKLARQAGFMDLESIALNFLTYYRMRR